jgi:hemerythrin
MWYDARMPRLFQWGGAHEIYLPEIDAEHRALFEAGEKIHQALQSGAGAEQLKPMVEALMGCAEDHFAHEERLMREAHYSAYEWHKGQHNAVRKRMGQFLANLEKGDAESPQLLLEYLADWLEGHTALTDRMMGSSLRNYERALHRRSLFRRGTAMPSAVIPHTS